jgi:hypothetical protein
MGFTKYATDLINRIKNQDIYYPSRIYVDEEPLEDLPIKNPYENHSWSGTDWFCIRCGSKLVELDFGCWKDMLDGPLNFHCSNEKCFHKLGPLTLHHPHGTNSAAGDSYSISWIK